MADEIDGMKKLKSKVGRRVFVLSKDDSSVPDFMHCMEEYLAGPQVRGGIPPYETKGIASRSEPSDEDAGDVAFSGGEICSVFSGLIMLKNMINLLLKHDSQLVVLVEANHIDNVYRDMIYHLLSRRVTNVPRFTLRISFFKADFENIRIDVDLIYNLQKTPEGQKELQGNFIGSTVLCPIGNGLLGRTLMAPAYFFGKNDGTVRLRVAEFELKIFGYKLKVEAFPYRMQDAEMMSCAETTLVNLLEYFSSCYSGYSMVLPSDLLLLEDESSSDRTIPARGIDYRRFSQLLGRLGFYPRLLSLASLEHASIGMPGYDQFRRYLYWYLGSGIPTAVNVAPSLPKKSGHSLVAIGFTDCPGDTLHDVKEYFLRGKSPAAGSSSIGVINRMTESGWGFLGGDYQDGTMKFCQIFQEADLPRALVTIDDSALPYHVRPYEGLASSQSMECANYAVPLHRGMALDAQDAFDVFRTILEDDNLGVLKWSAGSIPSAAPIIMRMFMLTAGSYRGARTYSSEEPIRYIYETQVLPHFVWVAELILLEDYLQDYDQPQVFAEIVLDATVSRRASFEDKLLLMRYPGKIAWREPADAEVSFASKNYMSWGFDGEGRSRFDRFKPYPFALKRCEGNTDSSAKA